jgi:hypothetical protein
MADGDGQIGRRLLPRGEEAGEHLEARIEEGRMDAVRRGLGRERVGEPQPPECLARAAPELAEALEGRAEAERARRRRRVVGRARHRLGTGGGERGE